MRLKACAPSSSAVLDPDNTGAYPGREDGATRPYTRVVPPAGPTHVPRGSQDLRQEPTGALVLRGREEGARGAVLDDHAPVGEVDVVGDIAGEVHLVGDEEAGHPVLREFPDRHPEGNRI